MTDGRGTLKVRARVPTGNGCTFSFHADPREDELYGIYCGSASDEGAVSIAPGMYTVHVEHLDYLPVVQDVDIRSGSTTEVDVEFIERACRIMGTVRSEGGTVLGGVGVGLELNGVEISHFGFPKTDEHGRFAFGGIPPGSYQLFTRQAGWNPSRQDVTIRNSAEAASVEIVLKART